MCKHSEIRKLFKKLQNLKIKNSASNAMRCGRVWASPLSLAATYGMLISFYSSWYWNVLLPRVRSEASRETRCFKFKIKKSKCKM